MRILVNAISARMGGIVTYTRNLHRSFSQRQVNAQFAISKSLQLDGDNTSPMAASQYRPFPRLLWEQTLWRSMVRESGCDVLFSSANFGLLFSPVPQVLLVREGGLFDPLYLANCTPEQGVKSTAQRHIRRRLILASARRAQHVITPTAATRDLLLAWAPDLEKRVTVNSYGTMSEAFVPASTRTWRGDGVLRLLYVSVYYPHKQPGLVCSTVRAANQAGLAAHATITMDIRETGDFRGGSHDGLVMEQAYADGLVTLGRHPYEALPQLYCSHDVFVFPSLSETFGHPMVEALSSGLPVVAADTAVNREVCGDAALYFDPLSSVSLLEALHRLDADPQLRQSLGERGRRRVLELYTWDQHVDRLLTILERVAAGGRTRKD